MVLRKITVDNSVRYVQNSEKPKEKNFKPNTIKAGSIPRKQNKNLSKNNKNYLRNLLPLQNNICTIIGHGYIQIYDYFLQFYE